MIVDVGYAVAGQNPPRFRDSNPYSDAEGNPLLSRDVTETTPRRKRS